MKTESGKFRWSTESIRRGTLFLERLGVVKPTVRATAESPTSDTTARMASEVAQ